MKTFALITLGCKVNQYEEERMRQSLLAAGLRETPLDEADLCIVNTCSVTAVADKKSRQMIRRALRANPAARVIAAGCAVENEQALSPDIPPGVIRLKVTEKELLPEILGLPPAPAHPGQRRTRALLKVQDGCNQFCSYCIVPYLRGREKSRPLKEALEEARTLFELGHQEIVITGVHLGAYGKDLSPRLSLLELLRLLLKELPRPRFRLSSIEPQDFDPAILDLMAQNSRLCPHLHLPLQHASPKILSAMRRNYTPDEYYQKVSLAASRIPGIAITTDILIGFPSESREDFFLLRDFIEQAPFSRLHVFKYSARPGTAAASLTDDVSAEEKEKRSRLLIQLGDKKTRLYKKSFLGRKLDVLIEEEKEKNILEGISENYLPILLRGPASLRGSVVPVEVRELTGENLWGVISES